MPMRSSQSLHVRISDDCEELSSLLSRLEDEVPEKARRPYGGFGSGQGGHPPLAAWNAPAAMLTMDIHAGARELETNLKHRISGRIRSRGGSSGNTLKCLAGLPALCAGVDYHDAMIAIKKIESWIYHARLVLGDADPVSRLPRLPGEGEPSCPFCRCPGTLRVRHATGLVMCLRPTCRASGKIEVGPFSGEPIVAWADGSTGIGVPAALSWQGGTRQGQGKAWRGGAGHGLAGRGVAGAYAAGNPILDSSAAYAKISDFLSRVRRRYAAFEPMFGI